MVSPGVDSSRRCYRPRSHEGPHGEGKDLVLEHVRTRSSSTCCSAPFNITHHPAMSIPCGVSDDLPVGMMLVGRHWDEATIYRAADAFERAEDWRLL